VKIHGLFDAEKRSEDLDLWMLVGAMPWMLYVEVA
jgi:hypothetical protein